jgi:phosphohistidine phosphatase
MTPEGHRRLILTRHAKSDWDDAALPDHDRPLKARGRRAAAELGEWLASRDYLPDEVLSSDAVRTRQTWEALAPALPAAPQPHWLPQLYQAGPAGMLAALRRATGRTVMMIGHNPGIAAFAAMLPARPPADPDFERFPTAATLIVDFQIDDWGAAEPGQGSAMDFFVPSERGG